jgi:hypothetical protein
LSLLSCQPSEKKVDALADMKVNADSLPSRDDFVVFSSPGSNKLNTVFIAEKNSTAIMRILYEDGRLVSQRQLSVNKGVNNWEFQLPSHYRGFILVQFTCGKISKTTKIKGSGG